MSAQTTKQATFWAAVAGTSLITPVLFNIAADKLGDRVPGLATLRSYVNKGS